MKIKEVRHMMTCDCNLRCLHCYMSAGEHDISQPVFSQKDFDRFYTFFKPGVVSATGGEPLLRKELVLKVARSTNLYGGAMELVTNGYLLTKSMVKELQQLNPRTFYQISLDGTEKYHNYLRRKKDAYKRAIRAIEMASKTGAKTKVRMTVTDGNFKLIPEVIKELDRLKMPNVCLVMRPLIFQGRAKRNKLSIFCQDFKIFDEFNSFAKIISVETTDNVGRCGCGIDTIAVDPRGDVYPCTYFIFKQEYKMGNILGNLEEIAEHGEFKKYEGVCYARYLRKRVSI